MTWTTKEQELIDALARAVDEKGEDYVYRAVRNDPDSLPTCHYQNPDGQPGCIFGHAFAAMGVLEDVHANYEGAPVSDILQGLELVENQRLLRASDNAQMHQDSGEEWGFVFGEFESYLNR